MSNCLITKLEQSYSSLIIICCDFFPLVKRCFVERSAWGRIVERLNCICCGVKNRSQADQESIQAITIVCSDDSILSALLVEAQLGSSEEHCLESVSTLNESNSVIKIVFIIINRLVMDIVNNLMIIFRAILDQIW